MESGDRVYEGLVRLRALRGGAMSNVLSINDLRPEVLAFAYLMERELREHDDREGWKDCGSGWLMERLMEEFDELEVAITERFPPRSIGSEAADVANFAMMIADVCGALAETTDEEVEK